MSKDMLGTFEATVLELNKPTSTGRIFSDTIGMEILSDPILREQINNGGLPIFFDQDEAEPNNMMNIAGVVSDIKYDQENDSLETKCVVLKTPQGKVLNRMLIKDTPVSLSIRGNGETDEKHNVTKFEANSIGVFPFQKLWKNPIKNYKKD